MKSFAGAAPAAALRRAASSAAATLFVSAVRAGAGLPALGPAVFGPAVFAGFGRPASAPTGAFVTVSVAAFGGAAFGGAAFGTSLTGVLAEASATVCPFEDAFVTPDGEDAAAACGRDAIFASVGFRFAGLFTSAGAPLAVFVAVTSVFAFTLVVAFTGFSGFETVRDGAATLLAAAFVLPGASCLPMVFLVEDFAGAAFDSVLRAADFDLAWPAAPIKAARADRFCAAETADVRAPCARLPVFVEAVAAFEADGFDATAGREAAVLAGRVFAEAVLDEAVLDDVCLELALAGIVLPEVVLPEVVLPEAVLAEVAVLAARALTEEPAFDPDDGARGVFAVTGFVLGVIAHSLAGPRWRRAARRT